MGGLNAYQYCPNPVEWVDPLGLACKEVGSVAIATTVSERKRIAFEFYRSQGFDEDDIPSHLTGIDFDKPVEIVTLNEGTVVYQYQSLGAPQGNYYTNNPNVTPSELGISPLGTNRALNQVQPKVKNTYTLRQDTQVLKSIAKPVEDFWSVQGQSYPAKGGGIQMFSANKNAFSLGGL